MQVPRSIPPLWLAAAGLLCLVHGTVFAGGEAAAAMPSASSVGAAALPPQLPVRREVATGAEPGTWGSSLLALALTGAAGTWFAWRRASRTRSGSGSKLRPGHAVVSRLGSQALTPQASLHSVEWNGEELLVGCTPQHVTLLARRRNGEPPGAGS